MDEQEQMPTQNEEASALSSPEKMAGEVPVTPVQPAAGPDPSNNMMGASDILAPQKALEETLDTLKEYQETPAPQEPVPAQVQPEEITAETKLTVEEDPNFKGDTPPAPQAPPGGSIYAAPDYDNKDYGSQQFLKDLFSNGNECVTSSTGSFSVNDETRAMLALFSNGRFFVVDDSVKSIISSFVASVKGS